MARHVFISHAKEDRERIRPVLLALLSAGFDLWIDAPRKFGLHNDPRVKGIPAQSSKWRASLRDAVETAGAVIVFWSKTAVEDERAVLHAEVLTGWSRGVLIQLLIDPVSKDLPFGFKHGQVIDVVDELRAKGDRIGAGDIMDIIDAVKALLSLAPAAPPSAVAPPQPGPEFRSLVAGGAPQGAASVIVLRSAVHDDDPLPYLVDRQAQRSLIVSELCQELSRERAARSCAFVMHCPPEERPDKFLHCLHHEVLGELQLPLNLGKSFDWTVRRLSWPSCGSRLNAQGPAGGMRSCLHAVSKDLMVGGAAYSSDPQAFAAHVASGLSDELKRVLLIHCEVQSDLWSVHDERLIELFLEWWATLPLANVNTRPVLLFKLIGQREGLRRGFSLFGGTRPAITDFVRRLDPQRFPQLRLVKLPVLDSIMASDLADWAESVFEHLAAARVPHAAIVKQAAPRLIGPDGRKKPLDEVSRLLKQLIDNRDFAEKWARGEGR